jgi:hypothetical protein
LGIDVAVGAIWVDRKTLVEKMVGIGVSKGGVRIVRGPVDEYGLGSHGCRGL